MTIDDQPRQVRRTMREGNGGANGTGSGKGGARLPERLKATREARGVDLFRVERDTKIRVKYLAAMEAGNFSELPGDVYARGFLRNYASYLGLDPDEAEAEWRRGNIAPRSPRRGSAPTPVAPRPAPAAPVRAAPVRAEITIPTLKLPALNWRSWLKGLSGNGTHPAAGPDSASAAVAGEPDGTTVTGSATDTATTSSTPDLTRHDNVPAAAVQAAAELEGQVSVADAGAAKVADEPETEIRRAEPRRISIPIPAFLHRHDDAVTEPFRGPEPLVVPRRSFLLQPAHIVVLLLVVVILGVSGFFAIQAQKVLQDPTLTVTSPVQGFTEVSTDTHSYRLEGKSTARAEISISLDQRSAQQTQADASGNWSFVVTLHSGVNQIDVFSTDLSTNHKSATVTRFLSVPAPTASPMPLYLSVDSPSSGQSFVKGNITVTGTTVAIQYVTVTPTYMGPAPSNLPTPKPPAGSTPVPTEIPTLMPLASPTPVPSSSPTPTPRPTAVPSGVPSPVQVIPTIDGKYSAQLQLYSGTWQISVVGTSKTGLSTAPKTLTVIVTAGSLTVTILARGGSPALKIWKDGKPYAPYTTFQILGQGKTIKIVADQSVWVATGIPRYTWVTVNGVSFGQLSPGRSLASWRMTAFGPPTLSNDR